MPWNFPFWQVFRFAAPALMAGQRAGAQARLATCRSARSRIEDVVREAGLPEGLFRTLLVAGRRVERAHRGSPDRAR